MAFPYYKTAFATNAAEVRAAYKDMIEGISKKIIPMYP